MDLMFDSDALQKDGVLKPLKPRGWKLRPNSHSQLKELVSAIHDTQSSYSLTEVDAAYLEQPLYLSLEKFDQLVQYNPDDLTITVEAGMTYGELTKITAEHGQQFPLSYHKDARLYHIFSEDRPALETGIHGYPRDYLLAHQWLSPEGIQTKYGADVVKNVTGYDLNNFHSGNLHSLGVMTQVTLKLMASPETTAYCLLEHDTPEAALEKAHELALSAHPLNCCEVFKDNNHYCVFIVINGNKSQVKDTLNQLDTKKLTKKSYSSYLNALNDFSVKSQKSLVIECALPRFNDTAFSAIIHSECTSLKSKPTIQYRPAAGLIYLIWNENDTLPEDNQVSQLCQILGTEAAKCGGQVKLLKFPASFYALSKAINQPISPAIRKLSTHIKMSYDPNQCLFSSRLPLGKDPETLVVEGAAL